MRISRLLLLALLVCTGIVCSAAHGQPSQYVVPANPTSATPVHVLFLTPNSGCGAVAGVAVNGTNIQISLNCFSSCVATPAYTDFSLGLLAPGRYTIQLKCDTGPTATLTFSVTQGDFAVVPTLQPRVLAALLAALAATAFLTLRRA